MDLESWLTYGAMGLAAAIAPVGWWVATSAGSQAAAIVAAGFGGAIALLVLLWWWIKRRRSASYGSHPLNYRSSSSGSSRSALHNPIDSLPLNQDQVIDAVGEAAEIVVNEAIEELAAVASQQIQDWIEEKTIEPEPIAAESGNFADIFEAAESAADHGGAIESDSSSDYSSSDSGWSSSDSSSDYSSSDSGSDSGWSSSD
ncbi:MAG: hypothetical protein BJG00_009200 [Limnothrix sp. CACIAM 69d]|nr:MAG: hypothetical protein BJG00_009200 [Limnothrix sp. CACIAM 69d]